MLGFRICIFNTQISWKITINMNIFRNYERLKCESIMELFCKFHEFNRCYYCYLALFLLIFTSLSVLFSFLSYIPISQTLFLQRKCKLRECYFVFFRNCMVFKCLNSFLNYFSNHFFPPPRNRRLAFWLQWIPLLINPGQDL